MVAFERALVARGRALSRRGARAPGTSEGAPGLRPQYDADFYAAYVRDPDGNKLAAVCRGFTTPQAVSQTRSSGLKKMVVAHGRPSGNSA